MPLGRIVYSTTGCDVAVGYERRARLEIAKSVGAKEV
jgi:hypothetical protein